MLRLKHGLEIELSVTSLRQQLGCEMRSWRMGNSDTGRLPRIETPE